MATSDGPSAEGGPTSDRDVCKNEIKSQPSCDRRGDDREKLVGVEERFLTVPTSVSQQRAIDAIISFPQASLGKEYYGAIESARILRRLRRAPPPERTDSDDSLNQDRKITASTHQRPSDFYPVQNSATERQKMFTDRQQHRSEQGELVQQGPELVDSPRSERSGDESPRVVRTSFAEQPVGVNAAIRNWAASSHSQSEDNSPLLHKRVPDYDGGVSSRTLLEDVGKRETVVVVGDRRYSPRRVGQNRTAISQRSQPNFPHHFDQPTPQDPHCVPQQLFYNNNSAGIYRPLTPQQMMPPDYDAGQHQNNQAYFYGSPMDSPHHQTAPPFVSQQAPYIFHQTAVYPAPSHYYYAAPHPAPHPYVLGPTPATSWIYAPAPPHPPALFSPPASASSPSHRPLPTTSFQYLSSQRTMQDGGTGAESDRPVYACGGDGNGVQFRRPNPSSSPSPERQRGTFGGAHEEAKFDEAGRDTNLTETIPGHSLSSSTNRYYTGAKLEKQHGRTPLFGESPSWWGQGDDQATYDDDSVASAIYSEIDHPRLSTLRTSGRKAGYASDTEATTHFERPTFRQAPNDQSEAAPKLRGSVRMEVPLYSGEEAETNDQPERDKETKPRRSECATAFTIEFTNEKDTDASAKIGHVDKAQAAENNWKTQSAERMHRNFVRRSLRKSEGIASTPKAPVVQQQQPAKTVSAKSKAPPSSSGKAYLLEKMLTSATREKASDQQATAEKNLVEEGTHSQAEKYESALPNAGGSVEIREASSRDGEGIYANETLDRHDSDACSDAGTYVVDRDDEDSVAARSKIDQIFGVQLVDCKEDEELDLHRTPTPPFPPGGEDCDEMEPVIKPRFRNSNVSPADNEDGSVSTELYGAVDPEEERKRKDLLKQFVKITTPSASRTTNVAPKETTSKFKQLQPSVGESSAASKPPLSSTTPLVRESAALHYRRAAALNKRASFGTGGTPPTCAVSRSDSGRYSLRSSSATSANRSSVSAAVASKAMNRDIASSTAPKTLAAAKPQATKETENMKLWLRRKEYNPMKAAADAKKNRSMPTATRASENAAATTAEGHRTNDEPSFLSNRSQSFHLGTVLAKASQSGASSAALKKHPSVHDTRDVASYRRDDYEFETDGDRGAEEIGVLSDSAAAYRRPGGASDAGSMDQDSFEYLTSLSQELGQRAKRVLTKVNKSARGPTTAEAPRNLEKEAALAALLNQLRVASQALEEVDKIFPNANSEEVDCDLVRSTPSAVASRQTLMGKLRTAQPSDDLDV